MSIKSAETLGRRNRPPNEIAVRAVAVMVMIGVGLGVVGDVLAAGLSDRSPLTLLLLNPSDRYLLVASTEVSTALYFVLGFARQVLFDPFAYAIGFWSGHRVIDVFARRGRTPAQVRRRFERASIPLLLISPNAAVCMLAGASSISLRRFAALNTLGTIAHLFVIDRFGDMFDEQVERIVDVVSAYEVPLAVLAVGATLWSIRRGRTPTQLTGSYDGRVAIVGAGAAGLCAGHELAQRGADVTIFEARPVHGGRLTKTNSFGDIDLDLGGEWLTAPPDELERIASTATSIETLVKPYPTSARSAWFDGELHVEELGEFDHLNFVDTTWSGFFDHHVVPSVAERIRTNCEIVEIDHAGPTIRLTDANGVIHHADRVIFTAPLTALRNHRITFDPPLPAAKVEAIERAPIWGGIKVFLEFDEAFYPTFLAFADSDTPTGQRNFYDAAVAKPTNANVLGLVAVGSAAEPYLKRSGRDRVELILSELDDVFDGAASRTFVRDIAQDWSAEKFIGQAYLSDHAPDWIARELWEPIDDRVFFAGEAYTRHGDWGAVHDAARSARDVVDMILQR